MIASQHHLPAPEDWSFDGKMREQMWPEEGQLDGSWMENDPRVPWLMEVLRKDLKTKKYLLIARSGPVVEALENAYVYMRVFVQQCSMRA